MNSNQAMSATGPFRLNEQTSIGVACITTGALSPPQRDQNCKMSAVPSMATMQESGNPNRQ